MGRSVPKLVSRMEVFRNKCVITDTWKCRHSLNLACLPIPPLSQENTVGFQSDALIRGVKPNWSYWSQSQMDPVWDYLSPNSVPDLL